MDTRINYSRLPEHIRAEMKQYIENRVPPGDFLMAVLSNSLTDDPIGATSALLVYAIYRSRSTKRFKVTPEIERAVKSASKRGRDLGDFIVESFGRADFINRKRMFDIAGFLYNEAPARCWGSPEKVARWLQCER